MKSLKNHLSVIVPLFILLFSYQFVITLEKTVNNYEKTLAGEYTIVAVAFSNLDEYEIKQQVKVVDTVSEISKDKYLEKLKSNLSNADILVLKATLPKFYSIKLKSLPTKSELSEIAEKLKKIKNVKKIETFQRTFGKFHQFLKLTKSISSVFTLFIFIISFLLIIKQMEIWTLQHKERMYIMGLFGAPFWMKSATLYKSVTIDSLIAAFLVGLLYYVFPKLDSFKFIVEEVGIKIAPFDMFNDSLMLILVSILISLFSVTTVILRQKKV